MQVPDSTSLVAFVAAALVVLVIPGPGVLYVVARSLSQGQRAGLVSVVGLSAGALAHVIAATVGLSAVLLASATAFVVVKALGSGYLLWLGIRAICARTGSKEARAADPRPPRRLFLDGVMVSVLNPKIAMFFLAFLPQFIAPERGSVPQQVLFLGVLYVAMALVTDGAYALLAGHCGHWLCGGAAAAPMRYASGLVYLGLGVATALVDRR